MKLAQLTESTVPTKAAQYLKRQGVEYTTNMSGELTIKGDFRVTSTIPGVFPKIDHVLGNFKMDFPSGPKFQFVPAKVAGDCWIRTKNEVGINSSQLPRSSNGKGKLELMGLGYLTLDDDTLFTYADYTCVPIIVGGMSLLPRHFQFVSHGFGFNFDGIPPSIKASSMSIHASEASQLKYFHRRFTSLNVQALNLFVTSECPLLWLLKLPNIKNFSLNMFDGGYTVPQQRELIAILRSAKSNNADIFDVQERLIEAGFAANAKL